MKKTILFLSAMFGGALIMGYKGTITSQNSDDLFSINTVVDDVKAQASKELKKAFVSEIEDFFKNNDLETSLGISSTERDELETSIKAYLDNCNLDEKKLNEAKASVENLLENAKGLSAEEMQDRISKAFSRNSE